MNKKVVFLFSGQGSQYYQMGKSLFNLNSEFRSQMRLLDEAVKEQAGFSIIEIIYDPDLKKSEQFTRTLYSHPAIFMVQYALVQTVLKIDIIPDYLFGASLGEYVSLAVSQVLPIKEILNAILYQAQCFEKLCPKGKMVAILPTLETKANEIILDKSLQIAAINYQNHIIVSGNSNDISELIDTLKYNRITYVELPVSFAFHSKEIDCAREAYLKNFNEIEFNLPKASMLSCLSGSIVKDIDKIYLWDIVRKKMDVPRAVNYLENIGEFIYLDFSPSGTMANFVKNNLSPKSASETHTILSPFSDRDDILEVVKKKVTKHIKSNKSIKEDKMVAYIFPGQGSQKKGMGKDLFGKFPELIQKADSIVGHSIEDLCLNDNNNCLQKTQYTQPALFVVNALEYLNMNNNGHKKPDYLAGHSLGEFNALHAGGAITFETGVRLVQKRGEIMSKINNGGMAAVIGLDEEAVDRILEDENLSTLDVANLNSTYQIVLSGLKEDISTAQTIFERHGCKAFIPLNVSGAFHSRYMEDAGEEFGSFIHDMEFSMLNIPVISNVTARPYKSNQMKSLIKRQMSTTVRWHESIRYLMGRRVNEFKELGPGKVLTGLIQKITKEAQPIVVPEESENGESRDLNRTITVITPKSEKSFHTISTQSEITSESLGSEEFKKDYKLKYAYVSGGMYHGIASKEMVVRMGQSGMLAFLGSGALSIDEIEESIKFIKANLRNGESYGVNIVYMPTAAEKENQIIDLLLKNEVRIIEAAAFMSITESLVRYRAFGLSRNGDSGIKIDNKILAKISRPEVATSFLNPAPERIIEKLIQSGEISIEQAELIRRVPMADDLCVEADSGGHTDQGVAYTLLPAIIRIRDEIMTLHHYSKKIRVGAAGGIGTPESALSSFMLGAEFILTGSINQCTVEAKTSDAVKDILQNISVQDTDYAPAGDMFEIGAKVQVVKKGVFFPARANKLYDLYRFYNSIDEIDTETKNRIQDKFFGCTFEEAYRDVKDFYSDSELENIERNPKRKMALIFRWYFGNGTRLALNGNIKRKVDFQIQCGPALGAFNQMVKNTKYENWRNRHVDEIGIMILRDTAKLLKECFARFNI